MGLILELVDEIIPVRPNGNSTITDINFEQGIRTEIWTLRHALPNAIFQFLDCIIIPLFTLMLITDVLHHFSIGMAFVTVLAVFSSLFSIFQFLYFFIKPVDTYLSFRDRILGETAIGSLASAIFKKSFKVFIKPAK